MITAWSHFPNAAHIDRVIASVSNNPDNWPKTSIWDIPQDVIWDAAWDTAWNMSEVEMWTVSRDAMWNAVKNMAASTLNRGAEWDAAWHAIVALAASDDCAYMLDSDPGELAIIAKLGDHRAVLLLPACIALSKEKELV